MKLFANIPRVLYIRFENKDAFTASEEKLKELVADCDGIDSIVVMLKAEKQYKALPDSFNIGITPKLVEVLKENFGEDNVVVSNKRLSNKR